MKNFVKGERNLTVPAPAAVVSGQLIVIGALIGITMKAAASGEDVALTTEGVHGYAKEPSLAVSRGDKLYFDSANNRLTKTASGNTLVGFAERPALAADATVNLYLDPSIN